MKTIKLNEQQIKNIVNRSVKKVLNEMAGANFTYAISSLYHLVSDLCGGRDIQQSIIDWFYDADTDDYKYNEDGMYYVTRQIANYDLISFEEDGRIDVKNSNHPDIAQKLEPFVTPQMGQQILASFGW